MSEFDNILGEDTFVKNVVDEAKESVVEEVISFNTSDNDFGADTEEGFEEIEEGEEIEERKVFEPIDEGTATIQDKEDFFKEEELTEVEKKRNFIYCQLYILLAGEGVGLLSKWIAGDWSEEADKKYAITKTKQNEIARAWAEVLNLELKKKSPKNNLWMLIVSAFIPVIIMAGKEGARKRVEKKRKAEEAKKSKLKPVVKTEEAKVIEIHKNPELKKQQEFTTPQKVEVKTELKTATITETKEVKEPEEPKKKSKRGRKKGGRKNPKTGKSEGFVKVIMKERGGALNPYYVYSWGEEKIVPKKDRESVIKNFVDE